MVAMLVGEKEMVNSRRDGGQVCKVLSPVPLPLCQRCPQGYGLPLQQTFPLRNSYTLLMRVSSLLRTIEQISTGSTGAASSLRLMVSRHSRESSRAYSAGYPGLGSILGLSHPADLHLYRLSWRLSD